GRLARGRLLLLLRLVRRLGLAFGLLTLFFMGAAHHHGLSGQLFGFVGVAFGHGIGHHAEAPHHRAEDHLPVGFAFPLRLPFHLLALACFFLATAQLGLPSRFLRGEPGAMPRHLLVHHRHPRIVGGRRRRRRRRRRGRRRLARRVDPISPCFVHRGHPQGVAAAAATVGPDQHQV